MRFEHLSRAEQRYEVENVLPKVLAGLERMAPTVIVVGRVAREIGCDPAWVTGLILSIAKGGHPCARRNGEIFKKYGKTMRRWNWYPSAETAKEHEPMAAAQPVSAALPVGKLEAMMNREGIVDTTEW